MKAVSRRELEHIITNLPQDVQDSISNFQGVTPYKSRKLSNKKLDSIRYIEDLFSTLPPINEPITVYRGLHCPVDKVEFESRNYVFTTKIPFIANKYARGCLLNITISSGCVIIPLYMITTSDLRQDPRGRRYRSLFEQDGTVLLDRNCKFEIQHIEDSTIFVTYLPKASQDLTLIDIGDQQYDIEEKF